MSAPIPEDLKFWHNSLCDDKENYFNAPVAAVRELIERIASLEAALRGKDQTISLLQETQANHAWWVKRAGELEAQLAEMQKPVTDEEWPR